MSPDERIEAYAARRGLQLDAEDDLPQGQGGRVRRATTDTSRTVIKAPRATHLYKQELAVYQYLKQVEVDDIPLPSDEVVSIPVLLDHDDELEVFEITRVDQPFLLDFAGAKLDRRPDFDDEMWLSRLTDLHPEHRVHDALLVIRAMDHVGVFLTDLHAGNLCFPEYHDLPPGSTFAGLFS